MAHDREEDFLQTLRWMRENIDLSSSVYRTTSHAAVIDSAIVVDSDGNPRRRGSSSPADLDDWYLNSVVGLTCCCYMDALGKVILRGKGGYRLNTFVQAHMPDLKAECDAKAGKFTIETLYLTYRCGFVHQFASGEMAWRRCGRAKAYWFDNKGKPGLNIDRFAEGTVGGIDHFEAWFKSQVLSGPTTYKDFFDWLDAR